MKLGQEQVQVHDDKLLMESISQRIDMYDRQMDNQETVGLSESAVQIEQQVLDEKTSPAQGLPGTASIVDEIPDTKHTQMTLGEAI